MKIWIPFIIIVSTCLFIELLRFLQIPVLNALAGWSLIGIDLLVGPSGWHALRRWIATQQWWEQNGMLVTIIIGSVAAIGWIFFVPYLCAGISARSHRKSMVFAASLVSSVYVGLQYRDIWSVGIISFLVALPFLLLTFWGGIGLRYLLRRRSEATHAQKA